MNVFPPTDDLTRQERVVLIAFIDYRNRYNSSPSLRRLIGEGDVGLSINSVSTLSLRIKGLIEKGYLFRSGCKYDCGYVNLTVKTKKLMEGNNDK